LEDRGFTLLELMIVIVIIAIGAALAAPDMGVWVSKQRLKSASRSVFYHLQQVRGEAVKENITLTISFDLENNTYSAGTVIPNQDMPGGVVISSVCSTVSGISTTGFDGRGLSTRPGNIVITSSDTGDIRTIVISPGGSISIQ